MFMKMQLYLGKLNVLINKNAGGYLLIVWPDSSKFRHLGNILKSILIELCVYLVLGKIDNLFGTFECFLANFRWCKLPNNWTNKITIWWHCLLIITLGGRIHSIFRHLRSSLVAGRDSLQVKSFFHSFLFLLFLHSFQAFCSKKCSLVGIRTQLAE